MPSGARFSELEELLERLHAKLSAQEVHALYLGALTSTNLGLGPQRLLDRILGDEPVGDTLAGAKEALQILFGYWNALTTDREGGRLGFAPATLPAEPTREDLRDFARRRHEELLWFVRGIDAGGDDPIEFGAEGQELLKRIAEAGAFLQAYVDMLGRDTAASRADLQKARGLLLDTVAAAEQLIADLMVVSDAVRREALDTFAREAGRKTDDGTHVARAVKVGRNDACPCGSGKKWKKCCGSTVQ